jgi:preprotein translocase subunit SecA
VFGLDVGLDELKAMGRDELQQELTARARAAFEAKEQEIGPELMLSYARLIMLQIVDSQWKDHLYAIDHLKEGISLRGYGQRDPLVEYKKESYEAFRELTNRIDEEILRWVHLYRPVSPGEERAPAAAGPRRPVRGLGGGTAVAEREPAMAGAAGLPAPRRAPPQGLVFNNPSDAPRAFANAERPEAKGGHDAAVQTIRREGKKVGRNDPCPCGSGRKYKKCHGAS